MLKKGPYARRGSESDEGLPDSDSATDAEIDAAFAAFVSDADPATVAEVLAALTGLTRAERSPRNLAATEITRIADKVQNRVLEYAGQDVDSCIAERLAAQVSAETHSTTRVIDISDYLPNDASLATPLPEEAPFRAVAATKLPHPMGLVYTERVISRSLDSTGRVAFDAAKDAVFLILQHPSAPPPECARVGDLMVQLGPPDSEGRHQLLNIRLGDFLSAYRRARLLRDS